MHKRENTYETITMSKTSQQTEKCYDNMIVHHLYAKWDPGRKINHNTGI